MSNDKVAATFHPGTEPAPAPAQDDDAVDGELLPLSVVGDMLTEVLNQLDGVADLIAAHRRAARDDHHALARLQDVTTRVNQAWTAVQLTRKALRS
jgi:hypothetical protein